MIKKMGNNGCCGTCKNEGDNLAGQVDVDQLRNQLRTNPNALRHTNLQYESIQKQMSYQNQDTFSNVFLLKNNYVSFRENNNYCNSLQGSQGKQIKNGNSNLNSSKNNKESLQQSSTTLKESSAQSMAGSNPELLEQMKEIEELINSMLGQSDEIQEYCIKNYPSKKLPDQSYYCGQVNEYGLREGKGIKELLNGSKYIGYWKDDKASGYGKLIYSSGESYEGEWSNDKANGVGKYVYNDGSVFIGEWKLDKQWGVGKELFPDGAYYIGDYAQGVKEGEGMLVFADNSIYEGQFSNNEINGKGVYKWPDGKIYKGEWVANKMNGLGYLKWNDEREYNGNFKDDKRDGFGTFKWRDGRVYSGDWLKGKQHGIGFFTDPNDGSKKMGEWSNGKRVRWIDNPDQQ